jgi:hypothetical protein
MIYRILTLVLIGHLNCLGQFSTRPVGIYKTSDRGNWHRLLVIDNDSTYYFIVVTDKAFEAVEPKEILKPKWYCDILNRDIHLQSTASYSPVPNVLSVIDSCLIKDQKGKLWNKIAEFDPGDNLLVYNDNGLYITFTANYQPIYSEYKTTTTVTRKYYYQLGEDQLKKFNAENIDPFIRIAKNKFQIILLATQQINDLFPVKTEEIVSGKGKRLNEYDTNGRLIQK